MFRRALAGLLSAALIAALSVSAQEKKDPPKKERIAVADPKEAAKDPDFAVQGEYVSDAPSKMGIQVIAKGEGKFDVKSYSGGLPGEGWNGETPKATTAARKDGKVLVSEKEDGTIEDGVIKAPDRTFKKIERKSKTIGAKPPEGAVVLFGKEGDEKNWTNGKLMELSDGTFLTVAKTGGLHSKEKFGAFKAHVEFRTPWMPNSTGQGRGNSGVYLQNRYEVQVLDSFGLKGENNECGGIYTQHKPSVNMCLPPLAWQTYDVDFTPAAFDADGKKTKNGRLTMRHNGVLIHDDVEFPKECPGGQPEKADPGPFQFQDHGDPVVYRNVWVEKK